MNRRLVVLVLGLALLAVGSGGLLVATGGQSAAPPTDAGQGGPTVANGTLEVHYIHVGQGAATLLVTPTNETVLIDTGDYRDDGEHVLDYLRTQNVTRLDYLVTSHADADHIGGHAAVVEYFETEADGVGAIYDPGIAASTLTDEAYLDAVDAHNVTLYRARRGDSLPTESIALDVLAPPNATLAGGDRNENSLVLSATYGTATVLFTGDAGRAEEAFLHDAANETLDATVLQAGHHGSNTSTGVALLDATRPRLAVISSGYDSPYGHPHEEVLHRLANRSIRTYWTATHGDVVVTTDGGTVMVATQQSAPSNPARLREGDPIDPGSQVAPVKRTQFAVDGRRATATDASTATDGASTPTAAATETVTTPATTQAGGGSGDSPLRLVAVHADAAGDEYENLTDEYLVFENAADEPLDLSGWQVADAAGHTYTVPSGVRLAPGERMTLHTGDGTDTSTDRYWGSERPIWNNDGDTVLVTTDAGDRVLEEAY